MISTLLTVNLMLTKIVLVGLAIKYILPFAYILDPFTGLVKPSRGLAPLKIQTEPGLNCFSPRMVV